MIKLTENTLQHIRGLAQNKGPGDLVVRLGVKAGGCSGTTYVLDFEDTVGPGDFTFDQAEFTVAVHRNSFHLLNGLEVDYIDSLVGGGFRFKNPNAVQSCGCGSSFRVAQELTEI